MAEKQISVRLIGRVDAYVAAMKRAEGATGQLSRASKRNLQQVGGQMQAVGRRMTTMITLPLALMAAGSVKAAMDWESSWAGVLKTVDGTAEQLADLEQGLRNMTRELPASHAEIAKVAEVAGQLGVGVEDIEAFSRVMLDLGETTNISAEDAAVALARFMNIMGTSAGEVSNLGSAIVDLGNNSATTESEIVEMSVRLAAAGRQAGLSETDVLAFSAALTSVGVNAEAGGTAFSKVFATINTAVIDGGEKLDQLASIAGVTSEEFRAAFEEDAAGAIASFIEGIGQMASRGESTTGVLKDLGLGNERTMRAVLSLGQAEGVLTDALALGENAWRENTALADEANKRYATTAAQFEIVRNKVVELGIDLGGILLPAVALVVDVIGRMAETFQSLPGPVQAVIIGISGVAAIAGPLIFIAGSLVKNFVAMRSAMLLLKGPALAASAAMAGILLAVGVGAVLWNTFTREQREADAWIRKVSDALKTQWTETLRVALASDGAEDAIVGLTAANAALSNALLDSGENGEGLAIALTNLGQDPADAFQILFGAAFDTEEMLRSLGAQAGLTEIQAAALSQAVREGGTDSMIGFTNSISRALQQMGMAPDAALEMARSLLPVGQNLDYVYDRAKQLADHGGFDEIAMQGLAAASRSSEASALIRQAMDELGLVTMDEAPLKVFFRFNELLATSNQETQDAVLGMDDFAGASAEIEQAVAGAAGEVDGFTGSVEEAAEAVTLTDEALDDLASAFELTSEWFDNNARMADAFSTELDHLFGSVDAQRAAQRELIAAGQDLHEQVHEIGKALDESGARFDVNTEAGRRNEESIIRARNAIFEHGIAMVRNGNSVDVATAATMEHIEALKDELRAAGFTDDEIRNLIQTYGLVPRNISTVLNIHGKALAELLIQEYRSTLTRIPGSQATTLITILDRGMYDFARQQLERLSLPITATLRVNYVAPSTPVYVGGTRLMAEGGFSRGPEPITWGEAGREVMFPLTRPNRMKDLLSDPMAAPIWRAMGELVGRGGAAAGDTIVNVYNNGRDLTPNDVAQAIRMARVAA